MKTLPLYFYIVGSLFFLAGSLVALWTASAGETRRAETGTGSVHEHATAESRDAQPLPGASQ